MSDIIPSKSHDEYARLVLSGLLVGLVVLVLLAEALVVAVVGRHRAHREVNHRVGHMIIIIIYVYTAVAGHLYFPLSSLDLEMNNKTSRMAVVLAKSKPR